MTSERRDINDFLYLTQLIKKKMKTKRITHVLLQGD